jgi:hypothetical protein
LLPDCSCIAAVPGDRLGMNNDFIQSALAHERQAGFQGEVAKDELARLAPRHVRVWNARKLVRARARRALRLQPVRDA